MSNLIKKVYVDHFTSEITYILNFYVDLGKNVVFNDQLFSCSYSSMGQTSYACTIYCTC